MIDVGDARKTWERMEKDRSETLTRAENNARVTIPSLFPPEGTTEGSDLRDPYQALGARAVNTLAAKIMLALFPPNTSFFSLGFDEVTQATLRQNELDIDEIQESLSLLENATIGELEQTNMRPVMNIAVRQLIVTGNSCLRIDDEGKFKHFSLRHYVVSRDPEGTVRKGIIREQVAIEMLPDEVREHCLDDREQERHSKNDDPIDLFTVMVREGDRYKVWQEIKNIEVPGSRGDYNLQTPPLLFLRWTELSNENYGRGMVDDYYGDFKALDDLSRDLLKASAAAAKVLYIRDPNAITSKRKLERAESGDILDGRREDIQTLQLEKLNDFQVTLERIRDIRSELVEAFLMSSTVQRQAERVTAEEIRFVAQELEDALGGVYSLLSHELQTPLARRFVKIMGDRDLIPDVPVDEVRFKVTTGLEALGRGHEVQKIMQFVQLLVNSLGPEFAARRLKGDGFSKRLAAGIGLNIDTLIKSDEEVQREIAQERMQQAAQDAAPGVAQETVRQQGGNDG